MRDRDPMFLPMLEGVETGYEDKFDFPSREGPPSLPYLLASVPRSGSTYVSHLLWRTGCLGAPLEYLNFEPLGPYGSAHDSPVQQLAYWRSALCRRTSANGAFGLKAFPIQLEDVHRRNPQLMTEVMSLLVGKGPASHVIQLRRRDRTAHAISYARALLSGIWRSEQEGEDRPEPEYSEAALADAERLIEQQEAGWEAMFRDLGIAPLLLEFEQALDDPEGFVLRVAEYLGVELDPEAKVDVPEIRQQSQSGARAWAEAHSKA